MTAPIEPTIRRSSSAAGRATAVADGDPAGPHHGLGWLSAVYDRHAGEAFDLAMRIEGTRLVAEEIVLQVFLDVVLPMGPASGDHAIHVAIRTSVIHAALASHQTQPPAITRRAEPQTADAGVRMVLDAWRDALRRYEAEADPIARATRFGLVERCRRSYQLVVQTIGE